MRFNFFRALSHCCEKTCLGWQRQLETEPEPGEMLNPLLGGAERLCLESPLSSGEAGCFDAFSEKTQIDQFLNRLKSILHLYWRYTFALCLFLIYRPNVRSGKCWQDLE